MTRIHWLILAVIVLAISNGAYYWWRNRGLITIHCEDWPPSKVVRTIERQGGITIKTNLPEDLKVRMHVDKVPVAEALETLTTVCEARWRLSYVFAPSLPDAHSAVNAFVTGERPEGWKQFFVPMFMSPTEESGLTPDPRADRWMVKPAEKAEFQAYAEQAAQSVNAAIAFPENWNPAVSKAPKEGPIREAAPALAKAAGGRVLEVFLIEKRSRDLADGPRPERGGDGPGPDLIDRGGFGRRGPGGERSEEDRERMRQAFAARAQAEIDKLPADKRAAAQAEFDERRKFFESLRNMSPEERREKMEERMSNPANQERFEQRMSEQIARMTPDQRVERANRYVQRKQSARGGGESTGR